MFAIFQNELVLGGIIGVIVLGLLIWRFIGLKKFGGWLIGNKTPEARRTNATARTETPTSETPTRTPTSE